MHFSYPFRSEWWITKFLVYLVYFKKGLLNQKVLSVQTFFFFKVWLFCLWIYKGGDAQCGKKGVDMEIDICINISDFFRTKVVWNIIRDDLAAFFPKSTFSKFRHVAILAIFGDFWWLLLLISSECSLWYQFFTQNLTLYKFYFWVFAKFRQLAILAIFGGYF